MATASVFLNLLALALPMALLQIYDRIIPNASHGTLTLLLAGVGLAVVLEALLRLARAEIVSWVGIQFEHRSACQAFRHLMGTPSDELEKVGPGELLERLGGLPTVREVFSEHWTLVVCDLPFVFLFLGLIAYVGGWLVLAPSTILLAVVGVALLSHGAHHRAITAFNEVRDRRQNFNIEVIQGLHSVKSLAMEGQMIQRFARLQEAVARHSHRMVQVNSNALGVGGVFSQLLTLSVVVFGGLMVVDHSLTVGGLSACTLLAGRALQPIQKAVALWSRWQSARMMRARFDTVFALPQEPRPQTTTTRPVQGAIELKDVRWRPNDTAGMVFSGIDLSVVPGERVAIAGDNGSGKSTLLRLIHGSLAPTEGQVLLDGIPVTAYDRDHLLRSGGIALIPQRGELLRGSILENLTMFRHERRKEALALASELGLDEVVYRLAQGYHTRCGDGTGDMLPRGVVQRIAVVRALVSRPRVLLFDEANASMDGPGDERLRQYFERMDRDVTLIMVSLRPSLQKVADRVLRIENGTLGPAQPPTPVGAVPPMAATTAAAG